MRRVRFYMKMSKKQNRTRPRKGENLSDYAEQLDEWFGEEELTLSEVRKRLEQSGCSVTLNQLSKWRRARQWERSRRQLLEQIAAGTRHCAEVEKEFGQNPPPELETIIKLHRVIILQLSAQMDARPEATRLAMALMKPVMDWARLQEQRRERELSEQKYRDQMAAQKAVIERELKAARAEGGISPETLEKIERELKLL